MKATHSPSKQRRVIEQGAHLIGIEWMIFFSP